VDKKPLIGVSILAVVLLVLGSLSNVVGYQTIQANQHVLLKDKISHHGKVFSSGIVSFLYFVIAFLTYLFLFLTQGSHMHQRELILYSLLWPFLYLLIWLLLYIA
jgi:Na+-translocating ferredoxin:NAD+ oxidoreductase RnfE subunit